MSNDDREQICLLFAHGLSINEIVKRLGVTRRSVQAALRDEGMSVELRREAWDAAALKLYKGGMAPIQIAEELECSQGKVISALRRLGVEKYIGGQRSKIDNEQVVQMYASGESHKRLAAAFGVAPSVILRILESNGVEKRKSAVAADVDETFFKKIDSEAKAYWLGFMFADGNVSKELLDFGFSVKSIDSLHADKFKADLKWGGRVRHCADSAQVFIRNHNTCVDLVDKGCLPRKSHILAAPEGVQESSCKDFIRGVVDGDGYIGSYPKYSALEIAGTKALLDWIDERLPVQSVYGATPHKSIYRIRYSGPAARTNIKWLYLGSTVSLDRKQERAEKIWT
jgi:DNA-binding CsgD family transcriptional regulator